MLETIVNLLLSLGVAVAGAAGLSVATDASADAHVDGVQVSLEEEFAQIVAHIEAARANAVETDDVTATDSAEDGLATAAAAIEGAMDLAPEEALPGLTIAHTAVTTAPADGGTPEDVPTDAPEGTPSGPPEEAPTGVPDDIPSGRP